MFFALVKMTIVDDLSETYSIFGVNYRLTMVNSVWKTLIFKQHTSFEVIMFICGPLEITKFVIR